MPSEKQIKAALKEGGKKGQDVLGMYELNSAKFFCTRVETANGNWELMDKILEGMNREVDEQAEDRKGGAGKIGKTLLFANDNVLLILNHMPKEAESMLSQKEWFDIIITRANAKQVGDAEQLPNDGGSVLKAEMKVNPETNDFPIKAIDTAMSDSYQFLLSKELVTPDESDDDENYAENAGIEW